MLTDAFEKFVLSLEIDNEEDIESKFKSITKRLNTSFWDSTSETEHGYMVGSLGRHTAIKGVSDMDMLFVLDKELFKTYDKRQHNGQSALLQDVKKEIKKRYPNTTVRGDGQVVVVSFNNYVVEVCPAFENVDGSYKYPDSNDGGTWRRTDPLVEIGESEFTIENTNRHFEYVCRMLRAWRNNVGFKMGGLLIDTLAHKFFNKYPSYNNASFSDYLKLFQDLFCYLKGLNKEQKYWRALGSNQPVYNKDGVFVNKAKKAYNKLKDLDEDSEDLYDVLQELFGKAFPIPEVVEKSNSSRFSNFTYDNNEQFIEDLFTVDIKYRLKIDCEVKQDGFREALLRTMLQTKKPLLRNKQLTFFVKDNELEEKELTHEIYWKVRNRGEEAVKRNMLRGNIAKGSDKKVESTSFKGGHYVECYIVQNGICVARDSVDVPIETEIFARR